MVDVRLTEMVPDVSGNVPSEAVSGHAALRIHREEGVEGGRLRVDEESREMRCLVWQSGQNASFNLVIPLSGKRRHG